MLKDETHQFEEIKDKEEVNDRQKWSFFRKKTFISILVIIVLLVIIGAILYKLSGNHSSQSPGKLLQNTRNEVSPASQSDIIDGYPRECEKRMGFDNYRSFNAFALDPANSNTMYVAVEYKGVYKSQDGGKTWNAKNKGLRGYPSKKNPQFPCPEQHPLLVVDPTNSQRLLLTSAANPGTLKDMNSESGGVYESLNGGESWHLLFNEKMNAWTYEALVIDPANPQTIFVGTTAMPASHNQADPNKIFVTQGIVYKTNDGGKTWKELPTGIVSYLRSGHLFINPDNSNHLLFTTLALPPNKGGGTIQSKQVGVLETRDGGKTWKKMETLPEDLRAIRESAVAPSNFNNIFLSIAKSNEEEVKLYSLDRGKTFNVVTTQVNFFRYDPHDSTGLRLLGLNLYTTPRTLFESLDGGKTWNSYSSIPKEATNELRISNIIWDPQNKNVVFLNGDEGKVWKSEDGGKTWQLILSLEILK